MLGLRSPASIREIDDCGTLLRRASSLCEMPADCRPERTIAAAVVTLDSLYVITHSRWKRFSGEAAGIRSRASAERRSPRTWPTSRPRPPSSGDRRFPAIDADTLTSVIEQLLIRLADPT
jgi:hypothetical protein